MGKGKALLLQGTSSVVGNVPFSLTPPFTIEVWCRPTARPLGSAGFLFAKGITFGIDPNGGVFVGLPNPNGQSGLRSQSNLSFGKWHHIALGGQLAGVRVIGDVYNLEVGKWHNMVMTTTRSKDNHLKGGPVSGRGTNWVYYNPEPFPASRAVQEFWIGVVGGNDGVLFSNDDGKVDEICLWSRPFSEKEVKEYYAGTKEKSSKEKK